MFITSAMNEFVDQNSFSGKGESGVRLVNGWHEVQHNITYYLHCLYFSTHSLKWSL